MNKIGKYTLYLLVVAAFLWALNIYLKPISHAKVLLNSSGEVENKIEDNFPYRDLNKNGKLDIYEDSRQPVESRVEDLLSQMTLEEKVGQMFHPPVLIKPDPLFKSYLDLPWAYKGKIFSISYEKSSVNVPLASKLKFLMTYDKGVLLKLSLIGI